MGVAALAVSNWNSHRNYREIVVYDFVHTTNAIHEEIVHRMISAIFKISPK